jgi:hypothetical protein
MRDSIRQERQTNQQMATFGSQVPSLDAPVTNHPRKDGLGDGHIGLCPKNSCGFRCCEFQQGNYIVLYPGEVEAARERNESLNHLDLIARDNGGYRAICHATHTAVCDDGYKPLDCRSYPFFPTLDEGSQKVGLMLKGQKCPLQPAEISGHERYVRDSWNTLLRERPEVARWLSQVQMVGYDLVTSPRTGSGQS